MQELLKRTKGLRRTVLIVDDDPIAREMLGAILGDFYEIIYAENGASALEIIRREKLTLSLVLLDLHMPELDGYSLLKIVRSDSELWRIPIIVLTSEKEAEVKSLQLDAADFITKPYDVPDVIRARVKHSIELAEARIIILDTERDELTGLFNKEFFFEYARRMEKQNNMPMDAIVLDINRFHFINELYGKSYGDQILRKIGNSIHELVTQVGGLACRSNSNCFGIYVPHIENYSLQLPQYISMIEKGLDDSRISIRMGVYMDEGDRLELEQRFERAALVCRKIENNYSTGYEIYNADLHNKELYSERLINDMDTALSEKQFKVFYQPKYNIKGNKPVITSFEALVRWFHPEYGLITPDEFIALFEDNGLIRRLDRYVWNEAASQIKKWKDEFGFSIPVSVNVSRVDAFDPKLVETLNEIVYKNGINNEDLLLEITESAYASNSQQIINTVAVLREQGFRIEMDDFGSGYSSLNMLCSLPVDALKLDMKFVRNICSNQKDYRLVGIMTEIARLLEVPVIVEGVETEQQFELLKKLGCDIIQGYYFSKPLPTEEITKLIRDSVQGDRSFCPFE